MLLSILTFIFSVLAFYLLFNHYRHRRKILKHTKPEYKNNTEKIYIYNNNYELKSNKYYQKIKMEIIKSGLDIDKNYYFTKILSFNLLLLIIIFFTLDSILWSLSFTFMSMILSPIFLLKIRTKRRKEKFISDFPHAVDSIVRAVQTGLPIGDGFALLAREGKEPIRSEFQRIIESRQYGLTLNEAIDGLIDRVDCPETRFFAAVIQIQAQSGGSISESLTNLSNLIRNRKRMSEKIKSMSAEAKASAYIIGSLPFFIIGAIYFTSPEYITLLFTTNTGIMTLIGCCFWMLTGCAIMIKMINFEI